MHWFFNPTLAMIIIVVLVLAAAWVGQGRDRKGGKD
jgi:hypothetical protein